ncbi:unnamed protein product [Polarella glacialis]|uniref:Protein kinase domain-containing protein n=1 Tax=Polarella glacialis TaxID=89957 RepID=A0A813FRF6_POLGL|nr:unnamed protein product [Polarella glacialis]
MRASKSRDRRRRRDQSRSRTRSRRREKKHKKDKLKSAPHISWKQGMALGPSGRYVVERLMGDGTFGRVLECTDSEGMEKVAVKVVKGVKRFCEHAEMEAEVLEEIQKADPTGKAHCVRMLGSFMHAEQNFCIVFEPLGASLRDFLKANDSRGFFVEDARQMARQLLESLAFMHGIGLTHTDLKCRNVMLRDASFEMAAFPRAGEKGVNVRRPRDCRIAVIDFGGAVFPDERHDGRVGTRQFRGPEMVLGLPWDESSDMFSAGCIISMLYLGQRPISVHEDQEHLAIMEKLCEHRLPTWMLKKAAGSKKAPEGLSLTAEGLLNWPAGAPDLEAVERVNEVKPLREQILPRHGSFLDVLKGLFQFDPQQRLSAKAALNYSFFADGVSAE